MSDNYTSQWLLRHGFIHRVLLFGNTEYILAVYQFVFQRFSAFEQQSLGDFAVGTNAFELHHTLILLPQCLQHSHHLAHSSHFIPQQIRFYTHITYINDHFNYSL